LTTICMTEPEA